MTSAADEGDDDYAYSGKELVTLKLINDSKYTSDSSFS